MNLFYFLKNLKKSFSKFKNCITVYISKENILHNLYVYKKEYKDLLFAPVLKSNAYGHGLVEIAKILDKENIPFFVVDSLYEANILKSRNISKDILIIGFTLKENILNFNSSKFIFSIISLEELKSISCYTNKNIRIHLKIDTGMHRQGLMMHDLDQAIKILKENQNIFLEGIFSHLSDADNQNKSFTLSQIENWKNVVEIFKNNFPNIKYFHLSATSGASLNEKDFGNVVRLGIGLFGFDNSNSKNLDLKGVVRVESLISSIRNLKKNESVGYSQTFIVKKDSILATVPMGYFEGVDRRLSNIGYFKIKDMFCDIAGMVSMNISSVDVSDIKDLKLEDRVIIISEKKKDLNSIENIANMANTIPYDILVHINPNLKRRVVNSFKEI
ncbi:MAG: alanine racemase [Candidatus Pacebacteria bacterium]|nr:alanine racemase [Candidatus Paceibacterota bacterium]